MAPSDYQHRAMQRFRVGDADARVSGLSTEMKGKIGEFLAGFQEDDKGVRHKR